jgi:hypothetical protein
LDIRNRMQAEMLEKTPDSRFIRITVAARNSSDITWTENDEFSYNGSRYDVVRSEKQADGSISYLCLNDAREDALFSQLDQNIQNQLDANKMANSKTGKLLLKLLAFEYLAEPQQIGYTQHVTSLTHRAYISAHTSIPTEITTPPPRVA